MTSRDAAPAAVSAGPLTAAAAKPCPALLDVNRLRPGPASSLRCGLKRDWSCPGWARRLVGESPHFAERSAPSHRRDRRVADGPWVLAVCRATESRAMSQGWRPDGPRTSASTILLESLRRGRAAATFRRADRHLGEIAVCRRCAAACKHSPRIVGE